VIGTDVGTPTNSGIRPRSLQLHKRCAARAAVLAFIAALTAPSACSASSADTYQLIGRILRPDGTPFKTDRTVVFLHGAIRPYSAETLAGPDGQFKFKNLASATYILIVEVPHAGELRKTVEVGAGFADSSRRVTVTVTFDRVAAEELDQVVSRAELSVPGEARQLYDKAVQYLGRRDTQGAVDCLKKAVEISPTYASAWNHLGTIAYQTGQYREAEDYFRKALAQEPGHYAALVNLGGALLAEGKFDESLVANQRAAKARPDDPLAHSQLGLSYFYLGNDGEAETQLQQAKALEAGHYSSPQLFLAEIYVRRNQPLAAAAEIEEYLRLHPDSDKATELRKSLDSLRVAGKRIAP